MIKMNKRSANVLGLIIIAIPLLMPQCLSAASTDNGQFNLSIPSICKLSVSNANQQIDLIQDASGEVAYEAGYVSGAPGKPSLLVDSNTGWKLSASVSFNWAPVNGYQKATADLKVKVTSASGHQTHFTDYTALSLTDQEIASSRTGAGAETYNCDYRIMLDWKKDIPGSYSIIVTYTLSTQPV